jgi:hypothetical protein
VAAVVVALVSGGAGRRVLVVGHGVPPRFLPSSTGVRSSARFVTSSIMRRMYPLGVSER